MTAAEERAAATRGGLSSYSRAGVAMDTVVTVRVDTAQPAGDVAEALTRALRWFAVVEASCSRFDERSELVGLTLRTGIAVPVSSVLFEAVAFALEVACLTDGLFDPTVGRTQQQRGFDRSYITDTTDTTDTTGTSIAAQSGSVGATSTTEPASFRDVEVDRAAGTITLRKPLLLDLGAVAKGLAIDLAARELAAFERYAIEAGGDLYAGGADGRTAPWQVGIRHPRAEETLLGTVAVMNAAVCTSGDYERSGGPAGEHHLLDPRTGHSPQGVASVTVIAPTAMVADALGTAAFILGAAEGLNMLTEQGVDGLFVTDTGAVHTTAGLAEHYT